MPFDQPTRNRLARFVADARSPLSEEFTRQLQHEYGMDLGGGRWSELARGDYDHLSLALALWPARVVEKCAVDVELAARHKVRRFLWVRGGEGVWRRRKTPQDEIEHAIARTQMKGT